MTVEEIADNFDKTIKKGFTRIHILLILEKEPCHGYKLKKLIDELTLNLWDTPLSTIYTVLNIMNKEKLVTFTEKSFGSRIRKIYEITPKGKETLKIILKEYLTVRESINSLMTHTIGTNKEFLNILFDKIDPFVMPFERNLLKNNHAKDKLEFLEILEMFKTVISKRIKELKDLKQQIEKSISNSKKKIFAKNE
ncbi:MAG: helix-turn-helix transcriptional regulator [Promethearchaeota archaeon]